MRNKWFATGDATFSGDGIAVLVLFPKSQSEWVYGSFLGAIEELGHSDAWVTGGESTPVEAAELFKTIYDGIRPMLFIVGMLAQFAYLPDPVTGWLPCDGALYYKADYPTLYDAIGDVYTDGGDPSDSFRVPDMRGRVGLTKDDGAGVMSAGWADTLGGTGGEETHQLTESELAAHSHSVFISPLLGVAPGEVSFEIPDPIITGVTGNTGGDVPHNNVQPSFTVYTCILSRF